MENRIEGQLSVQVYIYIYNIKQKSWFDEEFAVIAGSEQCKHETSRYLRKKQGISEIQN
jgi:hypothetical protein